MKYVDWWLSRNSPDYGGIRGLIALHGDTQLYSTGLFKIDFKCDVTSKFPFFSIKNDSYLDPSSFIRIIKTQFLRWRMKKEYGVKFS